MGVSVEYSFNSCLALPELARAIGKRLGCALDPDPGDPETRFVGVFLGWELDLLSDHGFVNDRDLNFEDYRYQLGNYASGLGARPVQVAAITLGAYCLHEGELPIQGGMLTFDVQILMARYERRDRDWFDLVSGKRVVHPEHLVDVMARIRRMRGDD